MSKSLQTPLAQLLRRSSQAQLQARRHGLCSKELQALASALCDEAFAFELARTGVLDRPVPPVPTRGPRREER